jgi:NitT/TauT family transport system ATP-binding protein
MSAPFIDPLLAVPPVSPLRKTQISLRNISKEFRTGKRITPVMENISLDIRTGEIVGLLGPSGCGKSTLLNIIAGLDKDYAGEVLISGQPLLEQLERGFRVAYVFQEPRLLRWRTLRRNIEFALEARGFPRTEWAGRIDKVLSLVELSRFADYYPDQLSGGMQQRASIARAFSIEPDILLMDEPFSALDELTARRLREGLLGIWQAFRSTILFVSHNAYEASFLGDRVAILSRGPNSRMTAEVDLTDLGRPRSYDDTRLFERSKELVTIMRAHSTLDED